MLETTKRFYRVDRRRIGFIQFILEAYDNLAGMTTVDARQGVVQITTAPGCEAMVAGIIESLAEQFQLILIDGAPSAEAIEKYERDG